MPMSWSVHGLSDTLLIPLIQSDPQTIYRNDFGDPMTVLCFTEHHGISLLNPNITKMILYFSSINSFVLHCFKLCIYKTQSFFLTDLPSLDWCFHSEYMAQYTVTFGHFLVVPYFSSPAYLSIFVTCCIFLVRQRITIT